MVAGGNFSRMSERAEIGSWSFRKADMFFSSDLFIGRYYSDEGAGTLGVMLIGGRPVLSTLELPYRKNLREESCIPCGEYKYEMVVSGRHGITYEVTGVRGRDGILFHVGNSTEDTRGCILVGTRVEGSGKLVESREAMGRFVEMMAGRPEGVIVVAGVVGEEYGE